MLGNKRRRQKFIGNGVSCITTTMRLLRHSVQGPVILIAKVQRPFSDITSSYNQELFIDAV